MMSIIRCLSSCCETDLGFICRFLLRFTGKEEEVNLLGDGTEKPEFSEWSWMTPKQLLDIVRMLTSY